MATQERQLYKFQLLRRTIHETVDISWVQFANALKYLMSQRQQTIESIETDRKQRTEKWNDQWQDDTR
jgi:hypothetical protein